MVPFEHLRQGRTYSVFSAINPWALWRLYSYATGLLGLGFFFALGLATISAGTGAIYVADGPVTSNGLEIRNGIPTLRIALGKKLEYDMTWHTVEGSCTRYMRRTFTRVDADDPYSISSRKAAQSHAVGRPGVEHLAVDLPAGITAGLWHYTSTAEGECPQLSRKVEPVTFADLHLEIFDPDGPVATPLTKPKLLDQTVRVGGPLRYVQSWERFDATRSEIYNTFTLLGRTDGKPPEAVVERFPAINNPPGRNTDIEMSLPLPSAVHAGRWRMRQDLISTRPGGRTRVDRQFDIEIQVVD